MELEELLLALYISTKQKILICLLLNQRKKDRNSFHPIEVVPLCSVYVSPVPFVPSGDHSLHPTLVVSVGIVGQALSKTYLPWLP